MVVLNLLEDVVIDGVEVTFLCLGSKKVTLFGIGLHTPIHGPCL